MWVFPVARLCMAQNARYADTMLGKWIAQSTLKLDSRPFEACARSRQWIPDAVCGELMALESESDLARANLERLGAAHAKELDVLKVAVPYVMGAADATGSGKPLPQCPPPGAGSGIN